MVSSWALVALSLVGSGLAQSTAGTSYTDTATGIVFNTWDIPTTTTQGGLTLGFTFPSDAFTTDATEFIGILKCGSPNGKGTGWCGVSLGGPMTQTLMLVAYPNGEDVLTTFRYATGYTMPDLYTGDAKLTQISSTITDTGFELIFRCENCLAWNQNGQSGKATTSKKTLTLGWAHGYESPTTPECSDNIGLSQHDSASIFGGAFSDDAASAQYTTWSALATKTVTGSCGGSSTGGGSATTPGNATTSAVPITPATGVPVPSDTYDYIIVGAGAGGMPMADRLTEAGKSVLLIEKGPPSTAHWGGKMGPEWALENNLTRFDVPGLCNQIWADSKGIACTDTDQMAGCLLGGGTAVNAGLWWKPYPLDWDYNFPEGWKSADMSASTDKVFERIPGTIAPSMDGKRYLDEGFNVLSNGLTQAGWKSVNALEEPASKNHSFTHTPYMFSNGERSGPLATYLVSASQRTNFKLWTGTSVKRVVREGARITGVEVEAFLDGGYSGVVNLSPAGRVILSAGTFGSAKILLRSGIGPTDQLSIVKNSTDGPTMIDQAQWINLPVGHNLEDHTNTDLVITHPDVVFYDFYGAYDEPIAADKDSYLGGRNGILAQSAPNIGPVFFDEIEGADGIVRQLQWTARVEGSGGVSDKTAMTLSQYLGRGATSRGRMTITPTLNTIVSDAPYLKDENDVKAVIQGIENVKKALSSVAGLTFALPASNTTVADFVNNMVVSYSNRRANHWIGTNKMGLDDGRTGSGTAVVDTDTKVYGTDNLFVVDASIFPGMVTTNPSAYIVTVSEKAAERILALPDATGSSGTGSGGYGYNSTQPAATGGSPRQPAATGGSPLQTAALPGSTGVSSSPSSPSRPGSCTKRRRSARRSVRRSIRRS
ncbi:Cellobiose dehydrogenase [Ceratocystis fimbriata CBS 114723]|uniref:Cellobiose dehydrogenase n=1 Tax=Ceratocystis fimbriata CBS 114723 TaxID=1035309 RepID=A0A2C5XFU5_9PEZI|nr:Cellobiose dehydrogenase [Ceratocystis fimbriata CBS 114723]